MTATGYKLSARAAQAEAGARLARSNVTPLPPRPAPATRDDTPDRTGGLAISDMALAEASSRGAVGSVVTPHMMMARPKPVAGTVPSGIAMDAGVPVDQNYATVSAWALASAMHEGVAFLGYPYLSQLAQRAEYRHASLIWAEHATRRWVKYRGPDEAKLGELEAFLEAGVLQPDGSKLGGLQTRASFRKAAELDGLFGRSHIFIDVGSKGERSAPLVYDDRKVSKKQPVKRLRVVEPMWAYPGVYQSNDPLAAEFYTPEQWYVFGQTVHDSRFLTFVGYEVPDMLKPSYAFGGLSLTQMMKPYVDNWLRGRQSASDLLHSFSTMVMATDMSQVLSGGSGAPLYSRLDMFNRTRDNRGVMAINKDTEELTSVSTPLSGVDKLVAMAQEQMASAARIPLSIYLQITPTGLNASSEGEIRSFYADVHAYQERNFYQPLARIVDLACLSLWGQTAAQAGITFEFQDLWETNDVERATIRKMDAETDASLIASGVVNNEEVRTRMADDEGGAYFGLTGSAPEPEEDETVPPEDEDPLGDE